MRYCEIKGIELDDRFGVVVAGDDAIVRMPVDVDEDVIMNIINNESGMKLDDLRGTGTGFLSSSTYKGANLLRRYMLPDYSYY